MIVIGEYSVRKKSATESGHALGLFFYALIWSILLLIYPILIDSNLLWIVAMAIVPLVYGDGFAALVGGKWGKIKYHVFGGEKTVVGSLAMLSVTAVLSVFVWVFYSAMGYTLPELNFWYILIISALATVCEHLGITKEELMVCGDGLNDIPMFEFSDISLGINWTESRPVTLSFTSISDALDYLLQKRP